MTPDEQPLVSSRWPGLAAELRTALHEAGEKELARQVDSLEVIQQCDCGDDFCQSFYTQQPPDAPFGPGHRNVGLSPSLPGYLILDVVRDLIMFVEVLERPPLS